MNKVQREHRADEAARTITESAAIFRADIIARRAIAKSSPTAGDAGVNVRNVSTVEQDVALPTKATPHTVNSDGLAVRNAPARITHGSPMMAGGSPIMAGADRSRTVAVKPTSTSNGDFVPVSDIGSGIGIVELLQSHGITPGIVNGVLSIQRLYVPKAINVLASLK